MAPFITFEGIEGSGKTTQIQRLTKLLHQQGHSVLQTREPGGCSIADQIRGILLHPDNAEMDSRAELLLYAAARAQHIEQIVRPALNDNKVVICDRFTDATIAYQGDGRGLDRDLISQLNHLAAGNCRPGLTLLFDLPVETGLSRALQRESEQQNCTEGRFEREKTEFHQRIRNGYLQLAKSEPQRVKIIQADRSPEQVFEQVRGFVDSFLQAEDEK
ncbi:thymidylate kinase [Malonomonas rubra DSM 5091]|uniref:Thymidylate kinase n=1 Tax=Malonomonas rubra DSM 5091 TaxID=1122189 RepID=A0A1M6DGQ1_MALRU|nr:dTMP kinase [Malonomonas rubra]SHI72321.1 thymidylate kinase [Malonomonas rubra DSM 5091]